MQITNLGLANLRRKIMEIKEVDSLIEAFVGYREMLVPIQGELHDFLMTYDALKDSVDKLRTSFSDDAKEKLNEIYRSLSSQAKKSEEMALKVDEFLKSSARYTEGLNKLVSTFDGINDKLASVNEIEERAEEQIGKLEELIEEKKKNYNLKELQRSLEQYNANIEATSDFINKDIAVSVVESAKMVQSIKDGSENIVKYLEDEKKNVAELAENYQRSSELLRKIVEKNDVNEEYIFDILDRWAENRNIKFKKK